MTIRADTSDGKKFLTKAEKALHVARLALRDGAFDSTVVNSVHGSVNALEALSATRLGTKVSGLHSDVLLTVRPIFNPAEYFDIAKQFRSLMSKKNASEYDPSPMSKVEAETCLKWAEGIIDRVKKKIDDSD